MNMRRLLLLLLFAAPGAAADYRVETIAEGLEFPWSIAFLPDGALLVTERSGTLRVIRDGQLAAQPVAGVPDVFVQSQAGLFDVVLDPDFENNRQLYLSYAHGRRGRNATRVMRATFDGAALSDQQVIFTATPWKPGPNHFGGRMAFLPDGTLLLTTGEDFDWREKAQLLDNHLGKIIRINTDGSVPRDNPFTGSDAALPEIYSYGHRNPQAILVSGDGVIWMHEHGPAGGDELNVIEPGLNYGWPVITYGRDYSGARISPYTEYEGMQQPVTYWVPSIAPAGMALYDGELFPDWRGDLFVAALVERSVRRLDVDDGRIVGQEILLQELGERIRDVRAGPDGALYVLTDSAAGKVLRVAP